MSENSDNFQLISICLLFITLIMSSKSVNLNFKCIHGFLHGVDSAGINPQSSNTLPNRPACCKIFHLYLFIIRQTVEAAVDSYELVVHG